MAQDGIFSWSEYYKIAEDVWIERMSETVYKASRAEAADAIAGALAEGISPEDVGHVLSLAANAAVLRDRHNRTHGASVSSLAAGTLRISGSVSVIWTSDSFESSIAMRS